MVSKSQNQKLDCLVLGAGGAGLFAAGVAGQRGLRVAVLDHADQVGKKILISGGGRCNFTNIHTSPECYLSDNPHFAKSALARYTPQDFIDLIGQYNVGWHEKTLGQLFCDDRAQKIVDVLLGECAKGGVAIQLDETITAVRHDGSDFIVETEINRFCADKLIVATGGPSIPKIGATEFAYHLAEQFDIQVVTPRPALVPLTLGETDAAFKSLTGVAFDSVVSCASTKFREAALLTHKGLSGPAILQISSYWQPGTPIDVNFLPDVSDEAILQVKRERPKTRVRALLAGFVPDRLAAVLADKIGLEPPIGDVSDASLLSLAAQLRDWQFQPTGTEGYAKAEVTAGGISTDALSSKTMEVRNVPGLYFIGEAVDVTGWLGGYNFQWAWASGFAAGQSV